MPSTVLVVGSGGREHALAWKLSLSPRIKRLIVAPGNDGMPAQWERWRLPVNGTREELTAIARKAREEGVNLAVIGPDQSLADGIVDVLESHGIACFGPTAGAARIEASKGFAKEVMQAAGVPTARFFISHSASEARNLLRSVPWPEGSGWVVKADGLALGKGVHVCGNLTDALQAVEQLEALGSASRQWVIEERLSGEEVSWLAFCDGERCSLLEPARDYKRVRDGDQGPNTGGMGAFSPVSGLPAHWEKRVREEVFLPTLRELKKRGSPFRGVLYAGLMVDVARDRLWVIEFNARFGDPETQVLLTRMEGDLLDWCEAVARGDLRDLPERVPFSHEAAVVVVGAAQGYPADPRKGDRIEGPLEEQSAYFCAGVSRKDGVLCVSGGRVFGALGRGESLAAARAEAYARLGRVRFEGMHFRKDIAQ